MRPPPSASNPGQPPTRNCSDLPVDLPAVEAAARGGTTPSADSCTAWESMTAVGGSGYRPSTTRTHLNTHVSRAMRELVGAREWLTVFQLPAYPSELSPVESVWSHLKRSLVNLAKRDLAQLTAVAKTRLRRMRYQPGLLEGFLAGTRLDLTLP